MPTSQFPFTKLTSSTQISGRQSLLPIHLPLLRPVLCPMDIHQGDKTTNDPGQVQYGEASPGIRSSWNAEGFSLPPLITAGANAEGGTAENSGVHTPFGEKFNSCLSTDASNLMFSQTYYSLFNKWVISCSERHRDPISGPIADVANFLAKEGYKSRSLNSFRSAISSVHDPVDRIEVGKHPTISRLLKGAYHSSIGTSAIG